MNTYELWKNAPGLLPGEEIPQIHYYPTEQKTHLGCTVIFPGGGHTHRAKHEGEGYARFLNSIGMDAFVVDYRLFPYVFPVPLLDARRAVRFVRAHAEAFGIDPQKIAVMGSSAGGNLAALLCTCEIAFQEEQTDDTDLMNAMPNAQIHCYSYTTYVHPGLILESCNRTLFGEKADGLDPYSPELHVHAGTPQAFFFHTAQDTCVDVGHCFLYAAALHQYGIPTELHVFPDGDHGMGLGDHPERGNIHAEQCKPLLAQWLNHIGF